MHLNVLNETQLTQLELLKNFKREFTLVGGTAIALQIGHRKSIDFDLFKSIPFSTQKVKSKLSEKNIRFSILFEDFDGVHLQINGVKWTFFYYPFEIKQSLIKIQAFNMPDLLTLAAMKAYAIGRRSKWKDYVDLYLLLKKHFSLNEISEKAQQIFGDSFSKKMFKIQLGYFVEMDYSEPIEWIIKPIQEEEIKSFLLKVATNN